MLKAVLIGIGIGLSVSAPLGPTSVELIKRGLRSGFRAAFPLGLGAVTADLFYLILVAVGIGPFLSTYRDLRTVMWLVSFVILGYLGGSGIWGTLKNRKNRAGQETYSLQEEADSRIRPVQPVADNSFLLGVGIEISNPITIALWLSLGGGTLSALHGQSRWTIAALLIGVATGSTFWFGVLSGLVSAGRRFVKPVVFKAVTVVCSMVLLGFAIRFGYRGLMELLAH